MARGPRSARPGPREGDEIAISRSEVKMRLLSDRYCLTSMKRYGPASLLNASSNSRVCDRPFQKLVISSGVQIKRSIVLFL